MLQKEQKDKEHKSWITGPEIVKDKETEVNKKRTSKNVSLAAVLNGCDPIETEMIMKFAKDIIEAFPRIAQNRPPGHRGYLEATKDDAMKYMRSIAEGKETHESIRKKYRGGSPCLTSAQFHYQVPEGLHSRDRKRGSLIDQHKYKFTAPDAKVKEEMAQ